MKTEWTKLFPILGGTLLTSIFIASIGMLLASFASRRGYGTAAVIVFFLLAPAIVEMFRSVTSGSIKRYAVLGTPGLSHQRVRRLAVRHRGIAAFRRRSCGSPWP